METLLNFHINLKNKISLRNKISLGKFKIYNAENYIMVHAMIFGVQIKKKEKEEKIKEF